MPVRVLLSRLLLCFALVLNGTGVAVASTRMAQDHAMSHAAMPPESNADTSPEPPCHDTGTTGEHADAGQPAPDMPHPRPSGCCDAGTCTCACMHPSAALVPFAMAHDAAPPAAIAPCRLALGRPAPALPHPIRPPIG